MSSIDVLPPTSASADDWAALLPDSDHARLFQSHDWASTELGPLSTWCLELRLYTIQAFSDDRPAALYWGPHYLVIYNDAFTPILGNKHPALGVGFEILFAEVADVIVPILEAARTTRRASCLLPTLRLTLKRAQFDEEVFFSAPVTPLVLRTGMQGGLYISAQEMTRQILSERRTRMLNILSAPSDKLTSTSVYNHMAKCLDTNKFDIPFALLYKVETELEDSNYELALISNVGLPQTDKLLRQSRQLHDNVEFLPFLRAAQKQIITTALEPGVGGIDWRRVVWGGHQQPSTCFSTIPIRSAERLYGFIIVGSNPQRPINEDYNQFMSDLQRHATVAVAASISAEESLRRNERMQAQLAERERQVRYMAQHADICMMQLALDGTVLWANERYQIMVNGDDENVPRQTFIPEDQLIANDRANARKAWLQVLEGQKADTTELQLQRQYTPPTGDHVPSTILLSAFPYIELEEVKSVMACMTDVSRLKWAETWQTQMALDAREAKRQQSEFTDAISHEVRNPLSAILQLADSIAQVCDGLHEPTVQECMVSLEETADAARTILKCARHQKSIVDDVLTLSKMDFASISLSPAAVELDDIVQQALAIFEAEALAYSMTLQAFREPSLSTLSTGQLMCDPLRLTQILINLLSNAVKFTKRQRCRAITLRYGATESDPQSAFSSEVVWAPKQNKPLEDSTQQEQWNDHELLYLTFTVEDTGPGMTSDEMSRIFTRFQQASAKTSIQYGGSGLGLFISHSLIEKQGGRIGAFSTADVGSTFVFYIVARRVTAILEQFSNSISAAIDQERKTNVSIKPPIAAPRTSTRPTLERTTTPSQAFHFHVLLVEDNIINQQILRKQLVRSGCTVHIANHGVEALDFLRGSSLWSHNAGQGPRIDVVLMDWEMPVMDGLTCTREIRKLEKEGCFLAHPEVIAVTANVRPEQVQRAKDAGVDGLVAKPFTVTQLLEKVTQQLQRGRKHDL